MTPSLCLGLFWLVPFAPVHRPADAPAVLPPPIGLQEENSAYLHLVGRMGRPETQRDDLVCMQGPPLVDGSDSSHGYTGPGGGSGMGGSAQGNGPAGGSYQGPGDTAGGSGGGSGGGSPRPASGGSGGSPAPSGRTGGGAAQSPNGGVISTPSSAPRPVTLVTTQDDTWWLWWEYNKSQYLRPNRFSFTSARMTGEDPARALSRAVEEARTSTAALIDRMTLAQDATLRATAAIALGRLGQNEAIPKLRAMLADPSVDVRHNAILGLGALGSPEAVELLVPIARSGAVDPNSRDRISPAARSLAIVGMGLARQRRVDDRIDVEIAKLIQDRSRGDREPIGVAALVYQTLAPSAELERYALSLAKDEDESPSVRCRAVESLKHTSDPATVTELLKLLAGARMDLRRSAALALGDVPDPRVLPALIAAVQNESEPLARGFLLISIGKQGGEQARAFLMETLEKGESNARRWVVLALGIDAHRLANAEHSEAVGLAIRAASARERNPESRGAYWLALGLARSRHALDVLQTVLAEASDARERMYAASSLAMIGGEQATRILRERLQVESAPMARVAIANALGVLGASEDVPGILGMLQQLRQPSLQAHAASAIADTATPAALLALTDLARTEDGPPARRAAAVEGLGMILSPIPPLSLASVSCEANYTVFNDWLAAVFQTTL